MPGQESNHKKIMSEKEADKLLAEYLKSLDKDIVKELKDLETRMSKKV